jgi:hypothetical protein
VSVRLVETRHNLVPSIFDPPEQDQYDNWGYTFEVDGRTYEMRRYCDMPEEAHFLSNIRNADEQALADAGLIARYLIDEEGVEEVNRYNTATGTYDRPVEPA